jgi:SPP1 family predicted phage head-tail adaptor
VISGPRNRRITIERRTYTTDSFGGEIVAWIEVGSGWWVSSLPVKDSEAFRNSEATATITHRFQMLWSATAWAEIDPRCRITFDGRLYDVVAVKEIGRRDGIEISATARAENG